MKGIISADKSKLEAINRKINDDMFVRIPNYNAIQWGEIRKHPVTNVWLLIIGNPDSRNPETTLTANEKSQNIPFPFTEWFPSTPDPRNP